MKFHWMYRGNDTSIDGLKRVSTVVDYVGYESILMVYHSNIPDFLIKSAHVLNIDHKFKYMPAIRTYAISPEYFYMIYRAFEDISPDRVMFNILSGDIHQDENCVENMVFINDKMVSDADRLIYTEEWVNKFLSLSKNKKRPNIVMSGHSDKTKQIAKDNGFTHLSMLDMFLKNNNIINKNQMVALSIYVADSKEESDLFLSSLSDGPKKWTLVGTKDEIKSQIYSIADMGVTDFMISSSINDQNSYRIHDIIKEIIQEE